MRGRMDLHGLTDVGRSRRVNEDQFLIADLNKSMRVHQTSLHLDEETRLFGGSQGQMLLVADGMGGHAAGERASMIAVDSITNYMLNIMPWFFRLRPDYEGDFLDDLRQALQYGQHRIHAEAEKVPGRQGMGTTLTMAYLIWPRLYVVHAGDSRCYVLRPPNLKQITRDHTVAQQMVDKGALAPEEAEESRFSHILWNVVGGPSNELHPEVYKAELALGDTLLLCTDGLTKHVADEQIQHMLSADASAKEICHELVEAANAGGGTDNITVVVARFRDARHKQAEADTAVHEPVEALPTTMHDLAVAGGANMQRREGNQTRSEKAKNNPG